jgi:hypothetical protein
VQVSTDGGVNWPDLTAINHDWNQDWTRVQVPLTAYTNTAVRLRFITWSEWGTAPEQGLYLDSIGIGEPTPGAPTLAAPALLASEAFIRPTLVVTNAIDYQGDPLTYRFEVYADAGLTNLVAQVPAVASGAGVTSWQVDTDLPNNAQYWWRCRANDGTNDGPWMSTGTFFVNEVNHPPAPVMIFGPVNGVTLSNLADLLIWHPTTDPDAGDWVRAYHIQVATNADFTSLLIEANDLELDVPADEPYWAVAVSLGELPGCTNLPAGAVCYWRIRACDRRDLWSDWSEGPRTFKFGLSPLTAPTMRVTAGGVPGTIHFSWPETDRQVYIEFTPTLTPPEWRVITGPIRGTSWTGAPVPGAATGYYRLRIE